MTALALHPGRTRVLPIRKPVARAHPQLLLPPVVTPHPRPDPAELALHVPVTRSVLLTPNQDAWPVPQATPPGRDELPEPGPVAGAVTLAAVEALSGSRPVVQLARWVTPEVFEQLTARAPRRPPARQRRATVRTTRSWRVSPRVAEVSVVIHDGDRVRAAALRLEMHRRRWRASVLQIG